MRRTWLIREKSDGSEWTILAKFSQISPFPSPTDVASDLRKTRTTTDVAFPICNKDILTRVPCIDISLVSESFTTPGNPLQGQHVTGNRTRDYNWESP